MPFNIDTSTPGDTDLISGFPANERGMRTDLEGIIIQDHEEATGNHSKVGLIPDDTVPWGGVDPVLDGALGFLYTKDIGGTTELHYRDSAGDIVIITTAGVIAPLAVLKTGDTMTGALDMDNAEIRMTNDTHITGEIAATGTFRELIALNANDDVEVGSTSVPLGLVSNSAGLVTDTPPEDNGVIAIYPGGPDDERFWHEGNDGPGSTMDADTVDGVEAEEMFSDINSNSGSGFFFESVAQIVTAGAGETAIAHSLVTVPKLVTAHLQVKAGNSDAGYSALDEVVVASSNDATFGLSFGADDTNLFYGVGTSGLLLFNKSTQALAHLDETKWNLIIRAWK